MQQRSGFDGLGKEAQASALARLSGFPGIKKYHMMRTSNSKRIFAREAKRLVGTAKIRMPPPRAAGRHGSTQMMC